MSRLMVAGTNYALIGSCYSKGKPMTKIIPANKARQGRGGRHTLVILVVSLIVLAIGWMAIEFFSTVSDPDTEQSLPYEG